MHGVTSSFGKNWDKDILFNTLSKLHEKKRILKIDSASTYKFKNGDLINPSIIKFLQHSGKSTKVILKVGSNYESESAKNFYDHIMESVKMFPSCKKIQLMFHKPSIELIARDLKTAELLKKKNIEFNSLSSNNYEVIKEYVKIFNIKELQIALNPVDFNGCLKILKFCRQKKIHIMARSILASGLLTGNSWALKEKKNDNLRSRFWANRLNKIKLQKRIECKDKLFSYLRKFDEIKNFEIENIVLSLIGCNKYVNSIIVGGSNYQQMQKNILNSFKPSKTLQEKFLANMNFWNAPYI